MANYASSFSLLFIGSKDDEKEANAIVGQLLSEVDEYDNEYPDAFADDAAISNYDLQEVVSNAANILKGKFPSSQFTINAAFSHLSGEGEARYTRSYDGKELHGKDLVCDQDFDGCCPECGCEVVDIDDYDPNKKYICGECESELVFGGQDISYYEF